MPIDALIALLVGFINWISKHTLVGRLYTIVGPGAFLPVAGLPSYIYFFASSYPISWKVKALILSSFKDWADSVAKV